MPKKVKFKDISLNICQNCQMSSGHSKIVSVVKDVTYVKFVTFVKFVTDINYAKYVKYVK